MRYATIVAGVADLVIEQDTDPNWLLVGYTTPPAVEPAEQVDDTGDQSPADGEPPADDGEPEPFVPEPIYEPNPTRWVPCGDAGPGWLFDEEAGTFSPPPAPVPAAVSNRQGKLALIHAGKFAQVKVAIAAVEDPDQREMAQIEFEAGTWERGNAFLQQMWADLGGTPDELDDLFRLAVTL